MFERGLSTMILCIFFSPVLVGASGEPPEIEISNEFIVAKIYTPDVENGYYRGTRFDWTGIIHSLSYKGHEYFGEWQNSEDPYRHDRITGPVQEFRSNGKGLGYDEAEAGERFVRIGVGVCQKPEEEDYQWTHTYPLVEPGRWGIRKRENWVEFYHRIEANSANGYGYAYMKRLELLEGRPILLIKHDLVNTGEKTIQTEVYNHNFFVIDNRPTGPEFVVTFPWEITATHDLKDLIEIQGRSLHYLRELQAGEYISTGLTGFGPTESSHRIRIFNHEVKAGVLISTDKPLIRMNFWSPRTTLCPEPFIEMEIEPLKRETWETQYEFFVR